MEWIEAEGGLAGIEKRNEAKAKLLYDAIDGERRILRLPGREELALADERGVSRRRQ